jgi:hypothetical protein
MRKETKAAADAVAGEINRLLCQVVTKKVHQAFEELESVFADHSIRDNVMKCPGCKLRVTGLFNREVGCPNGCKHALQTVSWKDECLEAEAAIEKSVVKQLKESME